MEDNRIKVVRPATSPDARPEPVYLPGRAIRARFLRPEPGRWFLARPRLHRLLDAGTTGRLTAIVGAAGYGKTSLVSEWIATRGRTAGWITLDARSNDAQAFSVDLIETIHRIAPQSGRAALSLVITGPYPPPAQLASAIADDLAELDNPALIVLDEFQEITSGPTLDLIEQILHLAGMNLHLVICSRQQPALSLARLRTHGHALEIDSAALSFSREEVVAYLTMVLGTPPDDELVETWWRHSEGWIALIQLAAVNQMTRGDQVTGTLSLYQAREAVAEFLSADLLDHLPDTLHLFALISSVPSVVSADLATSLVAGRLPHVNASQMLDEIVRRGMFLSRLDQDGSWLRFHPLFRQVLHQRLLDLYGQGQVNVLHIATATWFAQHGKVDRALEHLLIAGDRTGAVELVSTHVQDALCHDQWLEVDGWLRQFPPEIADASLDLVLARAMVAQARGMFGSLPGLLEQATRLLNQDAVRNRPDRDLLEAEIDLLNAFVLQAAGREDEALADLIESSFQRLAGSGRYSELMSVPMYAIAAGRRYPEVAQRTIDAYVDRAMNDPGHLNGLRRLWGYSAQVVLSRHTGSIELYGARATRLLHQAEALGSKRLITQAHFYLGATAYERNALEQAAVHLQQVLHEPASGMTFLFVGGCQLVEVLDLLGDHDGAQTTLDTLTERVRDPSMTGYLPRLRQLAAHMALRRGEPSAGLAAIQHAMLSQTNWALRATQEYPLRFLTPLLEDGTDAQAARVREIVTTMSDHATNDHLPGPRLGYDMVLVWLDYQDGNGTAAHDRLHATLERASGMGRVRSIIDAGQFVRPLLEWHTHEGHGSEYVDLLIEAIEYDEAVLTRSLATLRKRTQTQAGQLPDPIEALTNRELDVLLGLQRRLSNKEIGDELSISHMTVKTHTRSIYAKLDVSGRRAAIARAIELGIIER